MANVTIAMVLWSMEMKSELHPVRNVRWERFQDLTTTKDTSGVGFATMEPLVKVMANVTL